MLVFLALSAYAQDSLPVPIPDLNAQLYRTPVDSSATLWTDDTTVTKAGGPVARVMAGYVHQPFVFVSDDDRRVPLLDHGAGLNLIAGYSVDHFRASIDVPVWLSATTASSATESPGGAGLGDIAVDLKVVGTDRETAAVGLGASARVTLPTGNVGDVPIGNPNLGWEIGGIVDKEVADGVLLAANLGVRGSNKAEMSNVTIGDALYFRVGGGYAINEVAGLSADVAGSLAFASLGEGASTPIEGLVGGWGHVADSWVLRGGVGTGLTRGIGAPVARVVFGISYEAPTVKDTDLDGIADGVDGCPLDAEDVDQFEDTDGCPELDNDKDGIADATDECPNDAEDVDSWQDSDGCKDLTTHVRVRVFDLQTGEAAVGLTSTVVAQVATAQPALTGDDDFEIDLAPGTYQLDTVLAGYLPLKAAAFEVKDGPPVEQRFTVQKDVVPGTLRLRVTDPSGNPIPTATYALNDNPAVAVGDAGKLESKLTPGGYVLMVRAEGFAPSTFPATVREGQTASFNVVLQPAKVVITKEKLDIKDKVFFETGKAIIKPESFKLLDEIAGILLDHPEILMVRIEGHTDARGAEADNLRLSQARAESVRTYFEGKGVEVTRLGAVGFGETRPLDPALTTKAYDKNRRVEFFIEKWAE